MKTVREFPESSRLEILQKFSEKKIPRPEDHQMEDERHTFIFVENIIWNFGIFGSLIFSSFTSIDRLGRLNYSFATITTNPSKLALRYRTFILLMQTKEVISISN